MHLTLDVLENSARGDILLQQLSKRERHDLAKVARPRVGRTIVTLEYLARDRQRSIQNRLDHLRLTRLGLTRAVISFLGNAALS